MDERLVHALQQRWGATLIETHISWVLLDGTHAWKFKKPVHLPFLDFTELATRQRLCEAELTLNRRLAPQLYLDVQPICGTPDVPEVNGTGPAIEYVLRMKQFPAGALMSERLAAGTLLPEHIDQLAHNLAAFHRAAPAAAQGSPYGTPQRIEDGMTNVLTGLAQQGHGEVVSILQTWAAQQAQALREIWSQRRATGHIIEGHGDLHLANVVILEDTVTAFDCIEFDPALRWIDTSNDIAFLVMDLMAHQRSDLAFRFLNAYLDQTGDHACLPTLRFYMVYRALVRALVAGLQGLAASAGRPDYLKLALQLIQAPAPHLVITHGVSGSGKTWQTQRLLEQTGAIRVRSDIERQRLPCAQDPAQRYGASAKQQTYDKLLALATIGLKAGYPVIVDATFLQQAERERFHQLALSMHVPFHILHCEAPLSTLQQRIRTRQAEGRDASEADEAVLARQLQGADPLTSAEQACTITLV